MNQKQELRKKSKPKRSRPFVNLTYRDVLEDVKMWADRRGMTPQQLQQKVWDWMDNEYVPVSRAQHDSLLNYETLTGVSIKRSVAEALNDFIECCISTRIESIVEKAGDTSHRMN
jgi:hypothetical protein